MKRITFLKSLFLLFALIVGSTSVWAENDPDVTYNFSSFTSAQTVTLKADNNNLTITLAKNSGSSNPAWSSNQARVYAKGSLKVASANNNIKKVVYTYVINENKNGVTPTIDGVSGKTNSGTWTESTKTWTGSDNEITFSTSGSAGNVGFTKLEIWYEETKTLSSIAVTTPPTTTAYKIGDAFSTAGMVVTGTYSDASTAPITNYTMKIGDDAIVNGDILASAGNKTITITSGEKTTTQDITVAGVTNLAVKTAPTKTQYKYGETLNLTGLELTATYSDSETRDITEGFTAEPAGGSELTASGNVTFTYYEQSCNQAYTVGTLSSLTYNSTGEGAFANTTYTEKDFFNPTGLVVTAHYSNGIEEVITDYTLTPNTTTELKTTNTYVTASYTWAETEQTVNIPITVNAGTKYKVSFDAGNGTYTGSDITETEYQGGITLPAATTSISGWTFAGWASEATANTATRPVLYVAGSKYYPTVNTTLYAVYSLADAVNKYCAATANSDIVNGTQVVISAVGTSYEKTLGNNNGTIIDINNFTPDANGKITCTNTQALWTLNISGGNIKITNNGKSLKRSSTTLSLDNTGSNWTISKSSYGTNRFLIKDASTNYYLERGSSNWTVYNVSPPTSSGTLNYYGLTIYVPAPTTYNSNPSAIITPTVEFGKEGTTLYLDAADKTYTNTATVEGVSKTIKYSSSDESIATVTSAGVVTAVGIGTATITAKVDEELGVSNAAQDTYKVTVKNTTTIAGIKNLTSSSSVDFTADLTDAVVTYVNGSHAYIQDASGAVYATCGTTLTAGQKINGAVSGSVKAAYQIDEITSLDVSEATITDDGIIPAAIGTTLATIKSAGTAYDGNLVTVNTVTVKTGMNDATSGGVITDDGETTTFNIIAPNKLTLKATEVGNFTGFVSIYVSGNTTTYRLNIYEASQYQKTQNVATAQELSFESDAIELDEETEAFENFTPQTVSGAQGTVAYAIEGDEIYNDFSTVDGTFTLKTGVYGTATITATAAAANITESGVTTPYTETSKSYTVAVRPRYTVNFSINGVANNVRQATFEAAVDVPNVEFLGSKVFVGWGETANATTPVEMGATYTPTADKTFYALFATEIVGDDVVNNEWYKNTGAEGTNATTGITASGNVNDNNGNPKPSFGLTSNTYNTVTLTGINLSSFKSATMTFDYQLGKSGTSYSTITVSQYDSSNQKLGDSKQITGTNNTSYLTTDAISLDKKCKKITIVASTPHPVFVDNIIIATVTAGISYEDYTSNVGTTNVIIDGNAKSIDLSAMTDATALAGVHADEITYTRTMGKLSTLYLPYASTIPDGMTAYEFNGINDAGTALNFNVVEGTTLNAYTPYVLEQEASASKTLSATNVDIAADTNGKIVKGEWTLMGTIARIENADLLAAAGTGTPYIVQSDKKWHPVQANAAVYIPAFRAYFIVSAANGAKVMEMNLGGETTSIDKLDVIDNLDDNAPIFNLAGQKVTKAYKGVVIQNGKKVVNK